MPIEYPSKSRVNKAGRRIRQSLRLESLTSDMTWHEDVEIVRAHRAAHRQPMVTANVSVRKYCSRQGLPASITQRLKRLDTILDKLSREPTLQLGNMQDIGGVRVVLHSVDDIWTMLDWLRRNHPDAQVSDYVTQPRSSGYRAVHVVAQWGSDPRKPVEIQLRSKVMHNWADMVEEASALLGINYKHDRESEFNTWALATSRIMEAQEFGKPVTPEMYRALRQASDNLFQTQSHSTGGE